MAQEQTPRDPHADNELIDRLDAEPGAQSGGSKGGLAADIATHDDEKSALGADPGHTRVTKSDKLQPIIPTRADNEPK